MADNNATTTDEHSAEFVSLSTVFDPINDINVDEASSSKAADQFEVPTDRFKLPVKKWNEIYGDLGFLSYRTKTICKLIELQVVVRNDQPFHYINLLSSKDIQGLVKQAKQKNGFKYLHIGSIVAGIEPLYRKGIPATVFMTLLDVRHNRYSDMLMGGISAPMVAGATAFDVVPNFAISLLDDHLDKVLMFQFGTQYLNMKVGSRTHALWFALYGRLFNTTVPIVKDPRASGSQQKYSLLWQTDSKGAQITVPRMLQLSEVNVPREWIVDLKSLKQLESPKNLTTIAHVQEHNNQARISFRDSASSSDSTSLLHPQLMRSLSNPVRQILSPERHNHQSRPQDPHLLHHHVPSPFPSSSENQSSTVSNPLTVQCHHPQFQELENGSMQCTNCAYIHPRYVRMLISGQQTSLTQAKLEEPVIPTFEDFMLKSVDEKYYIPCWPQHVIGPNQPDAPTQTKLLNYANLCIRKALLVQQNAMAKLIQMENAQQQASASMNTNFHTVIASLQSLDNKLRQSIDQQMQSDIQLLKSNYQSFRHDAEAWWRDSTNRLSSLSATTHTIAQSSQTVTTNTQSITKTLATVEQTTTQIRSQQLADTAQLHTTLQSLPKQITPASQRPVSNFPDATADIERMRALNTGKALVLHVPKPKEHQFDPMSGTWKSVNMVGQDHSDPSPNPYEQLYAFNENVPPLINLDTYDPIRNKSTLDGLRTWMDNAIHSGNLTQDQAIRKGLNALTGIARTTWDAMPADYKNDLINTGVQSVSSALYRMFVGQHDNEQRAALKKFKESKICDMSQLDQYCSDQYTNFYRSGQTNNNVWMYNTFLEGFPLQLQSYYREKILFSIMNTPDMSINDVTFPQLCQFIKEINSDLCTEKQNRRKKKEVLPYLKSGLCHCASTDYGCSKHYKKKHKYRAYQSQPDKEYKPYKKKFKHRFKRKKFLRRKDRVKRKDFQPTCFICKGPHYANKCPEKNKKGKHVRALQAINLADEPLTVVSEKSDSEDISVSEVSSFSDEDIPQIRHLRIQDDNESYHSCTSPSSSSSDSEISFYCNMYREHHAFGGRGRPHLPPDWLQLTPEEELERLRHKEDQLDARLKEMFTPYQHARVKAEKKKIAEKRAQLMDQLALEEEEMSYERIDLEAPSTTTSGRQQQSHGYVPNPIGQQAFAKSSRKVWLEERLAFLIQAKQDIIKEMNQVQRELNEFQGSSSSPSAFDKLMTEVEQKQKDLAVTESLKCDEEPFEVIGKGKSLPKQDHLIDLDEDHNPQQNQVYGYVKGMQNPCPAFLITVKLNGLKGYNLCALLDSGADCNLARKEAIPADCWLPTTTSIHSVTHSHNPIKFQAFIPIQFPHGICTVHFLQFPVEQYDCIIGSQTLQQWSPYTIGPQGSYIDFPFGQVSQINEHRAYTPRLSFVHNTKPVSNSRVWLTHQSLSAGGDLALIKADFEATILTKELTKYPRQMECSLPLKKDENGQEIVPKSKANYFILSKAEQELCEKDIKELLAKQIIRPSQSPFSCHVMYVSKKDEHGNEVAEKRLVVNYKPLNSCLVANQHPLPSKDYIWQRIQGCNVFSKFDLTKGFWQIKVKEEDRYKTAFAVPQGLFEWNVLPFGIKTAPSIFQGHMDRIFSPYSKFIQPYIDDILIFSQDYQSHMNHLKHFLSICQTHGICLNPTKLHWCTESLLFIGTKIEPNGRLYPQEHLLTAIQKVQVIDKKSLQRFLGLINYIAGHYQRVAEARKELNKVLKKNGVELNKDHQKIIQQIKDQCLKLPPLKIPGNGKKIVQTDASNEAWGAVLLEQVEANGKWHEEVVRYESGAFKGSELNYHSTHKELLAVINAFSKFQLFIGDQKFILRSDLKHISNFFKKESKNKVARGRLLRWAQFLDTFDFDTEYVEGVKNVLADFLSREGYQVNSLTEDEEMDHYEAFRPQEARHIPDIVNDICNAILIDQPIQRYNEDDPNYRQIAVMIQEEEEARQLEEQNWRNMVPAPEIEPVVIQEPQHVPIQVIQVEDQRHVRMIMERRETYPMCTNTPWIPDHYELTKRIYHDFRNAHFAGCRQLLTDSIIQRFPCEEADPAIRAYLAHSTTSATAFQWPIHVSSNTHISRQREWLMHHNMIDEYFLGIYPHDHIQFPSIVNYGYLHKIVFCTHRYTPITAYIYDEVHPTPEQEDTIELRTLEEFGRRRKPIWMFKTFETIAENRVPSISVPVAFLRCTKRILWKEESMDERLERTLYPGMPSEFDDEEDDDEAHSPRTQRF